MSEIYVDASVAIQWFVKGEPLRVKAVRLRNDSVAAGRRMVAPPLFEMEMDSIVQTRLAGGLVPLAAADRTLALIDRAPVVIVTVPGVRQRARDIARQFGQRKVYDATYAALADLLGCDFWTADQVFYSQVHRTLPFVKYLGNYP
jgi:predicted nucleic acid-binding protein